MKKNGKQQRKGEKRKEEREVQLEKINGKKDVKVEEAKEEVKNRNKIKMKQ